MLLAWLYVSCLHRVPCHDAALHVSPCWFIIHVRFSPLYLYVCSSRGETPMCARPSPASTTMRPQKMCPPSWVSQCDAEWGGRGVRGFFLGWRSTVLDSRVELLHGRAVRISIIPSFNHLMSYSAIRRGQLFTRRKCLHSGNVQRLPANSGEEF